MNKYSCLIIFFLMLSFQTEAQLFGGRLIPASSGSVGALACGDATTTGILTAGVSASGVSSVVSYSGGKSGPYSFQEISSTGVTGLTGTLPAGNFSNGTGNLTFTITGTPSGTGTASFEINIGGQSCTLQLEVAQVILYPIDDYFITSIYDVDYAPYTLQSTAATLDRNIPANGVNEAITVDVQGVLSTTGVSLYVPYQVTGGASAVLPAYSQTINIPSSYTEDGISRNVTFSYPEQILSAGTGFIAANLRSEVDTLKVKKLDVQMGIGNDVRGWLLGEFSFLLNYSGDTTSFDFRVIAGIPDKNFGLAGNTGNTEAYKFLYLPIALPNGTIWLNNNLGANYSNLNNSSFDPTKQAASVADFNAYGSLFQWGRRADGHELVSWNSSPPSTVSGTTTTKSQTPSHKDFIIQTITTCTDCNYDWRVNSNNALWNVGTANNPCPTGYRIPNKADFDNLLSSGIIPSSTPFDSDLKLPLPGFRQYNTGNHVQQGTGGYYWTYTAEPSNRISTLTMNSFSVFYGSNYKALGFSVRCIQNTTGTISALNCSSPTNVGTLTEGVLVSSGVSTTISYTGGNEGAYPTTLIPSTGVEGLTAMLVGSNFASGAGNLVFSITGTPTSAGVASFEVTVGGKTCTFTRTVDAAQVTASYTITTCTSGSTPIGGYFGTSLYSNEAAPADVKQQITVNVTALGAYSISFVSDTTGSQMTFAASGSFTTLGTQTLDLLPSGIVPDASLGVITFNGPAGCSFTRDFIHRSSNGTAILSNGVGQTPNSSGDYYILWSNEFDVGCFCSIRIPSVMPPAPDPKINYTVVKTGTYNMQANISGDPNFYFAASGTISSTGSQTITFGTQVGLPPTNAPSIALSDPNVPDCYDFDNGFGNNCPFQTNTITSSSFNIIFIDN